MGKDPRHIHSSTNNEQSAQQDIAPQQGDGNQQHPETILESILDGVVSYDRDWQFVYVNEKAAQMMGEKKEELIGKNLFELFPERVDSPIIREFQRIMQEGKSAQLDYFSPNTKRWLRTNFYPTSIGMTTFFADITEERKLEESARFLETLTQNIVDAVVCTDTKHTITSWNKGAEMLYGWQADEAIGQAAADLIPTQFPNNPHGRSEWQQALGTVGHWQGEVTQKRKNGETVHIFASIANVQDALGTVIGGIAINRDITERKRIEAALRESEAKLAEELADMKQLQQISSQLIQENNIKGLYEKVLEAAMSVMQSDMGSMQMLYPEKNELLLLTWKGFNPASAQFWEWVRLDSRSTCGEALRTMERVIVPDVETCDFMAGTDDLNSYCLSGIQAVQTTPLISRNGHVVGMISTHWRELHTPSERELRILDVLARQAADLIENAQSEQLRDTQERELAVILERQRFAREVHDGVNQSLFTIHTLAQSAPRLWEHNPQRAQEQFEQLVLISRGAMAEMRTLLLELRPALLVNTPLQELFMQLIHAAQVWNQISLTAQVELEQTLPEIAHMALYRIVQEGINNIVKHSQADEANVSLTAQAGLLQLRIWDNGQGFDPDGVNTEMGLISMRERAAAIGATFEIRSQLHVGTEILVKWPLQTENALSL